jgi:hypothetical protein
LLEGLLLERSTDTRQRERRESEQGHEARNQEENEDASRYTAAE